MTGRVPVVGVQASSDGAQLAAGEINRPAEGDGLAAPECLECARPFDLDESPDPDRCWHCWSWLDWYRSLSDPRWVS